MMLDVCLRRLFVFACLLFCFSNSVLAQNTVTGSVTASGAPVANARITVFTSSLQTFAETRTGTNGNYTLSGLASGTYRLGIAAPGFEYQETALTLSGSNLTRNFALLPESQQGRWDIIGNTAPEFLDATDIAVLTDEGKIFYCHNTEDPVLFDPVTGQKSFPAGFSIPSGCMNGTLLGNGKIIFVGGQQGEAPEDFRYAVRLVRTFDVNANSWTRLADLLYPDGRWYPGMARLSNGSLMAMGGGTTPNAARTDTCERFDLASQTWSYTGSMLNPSEFSPSALLYTGEALATWSPPQLYNPATGKWRLTGNFNQPNRGWPNHSDHSLVVLSDGRALAVGIRNIGSTNTTMGEIYNPVTGKWSLTSNPGLLRFQSEVVALPDGKVLAAAGEAQQNPPPVANVLNIVKWCDLYDPALNKWRRVADMNQFREYHAVTLLVPDGRVLTTGGTVIKFQTGPTSNDVEAFTPPYLLRGVRPQITQISNTTLTRGSTIALTIAPTTQLTSVVLMGTGATTHWVDGGVPRRLVLPVTQSNGVATIQLPTDPNLLPLGHYLLFAMVDDIPSVARIINVTNKISGTITLQETASAAQPLTFAFRPVSGGSPLVRTQTLMPTGISQGSFAFLDVPPGVYTLAIKGSKWLQSVVAVNASDSDIAGLAMTLPAGDADNNNRVDIGDFGILVNAYGGDSNVPGSSYDNRADFNDDGTVDIGDFGLLVNNYNQQGDL